MNIIIKKESFSNKIDTYKNELSKLLDNYNFKILKKLENKWLTMEERALDINWEIVIKSLISYNSKLLNILYFETSNSDKRSESISNNIKIKWSWRFGIYDFINIAKDKNIPEISFDIMESEIWFYETIIKDISNDNIVKNAYIKKWKNSNFFIINP